MGAAILFFVIHCNPIFSSEALQVMGEIYQGHDREIDSIKLELKSPQEIHRAPLIELNDTALMSQRQASPTDSPRRKIGFARRIESLAERKRFKEALTWMKIQDGGYTATLIISSPTAKALRIGIVVNKLPLEAEFRFFQIDNGTNETPAMFVTGEQINHLLQLNNAKDPRHPDSKTYWSPTVAGESMGIEIYLPPEIEPDDCDIAIPYLSHIEISPFVAREALLKNQNYGDSDPCHNDATCYSSWLSVRNTVAQVVFTESGESYSGTGTLLNDTDPSSDRPYFLTANHCIGSQTVASTMETLWFYESAECDSTTRNANFTSRYGGATLLWTHATTADNLDTNQDVSFLELNETPPSGAYYAGWNTVINAGEVTGIHHPAGDWKKISFGTQGESYKCYESEEGYFSCTPSSTGSFLSVVWTDGGIEGGSSGSGLFLNYDQLIGILKGGSGEPCGGTSYYTKFGAAYTAGNLSQWLDPSSCAYTVSPSSGTFTSSGGTNTISVAASSATCAWTSSESLSWVSLFPTSGTGDGTITVTVTANTGGARTGSMTIAGQTYTVNQLAKSSETGLTKTEVSQLYVALFGRASEGEGNRYWQSIGLAMTAVGDYMLETDAAKNYFGSSLDTDQAFIEHIYLNTLSKTSSDDPTGISYWVGELKKGSSRGYIVATLVGVIKDYAPGGPYYNADDAATVAAYNQFTNRVEVSDYMADTVEKPPAGWETSTAFNTGLIVTNDPQSVVAAKLLVDAMAE